MRKLPLVIPTIALLLGSFLSYANIVGNASAQLVATEGADKIKVTVAVGSMHFKMTPGAGLGGGYTYEADIGAFEGKPEVVMAWHVTSVHANRLGDVLFGQIEAANRKNPDGSVESMRVWLGPMREGSGFGPFDSGTPLDSTTPFNYPFYPDKSLKNSAEYPITLAEYYECTPMDSVAFAIRVLESDAQSTEATVAAAVLGVVGLGMAAAGVISSELGIGIGLLGLGEALIGTATDLAGTNGDEDWGGVSTIKNAPGEYEITTTGGKDGSVHVDWKISTEVVEEDSPDCRDKKTAMGIRDYYDEGTRASTQFAVLRDVISGTPTQTDGETGGNLTAADAAVFAANGTQMSLLKLIASNNTKSLTLKAQELAAKNESLTAIDLYEAAYLHAIDSERARAGKYQPTLVAVDLDSSVEFQDSRFSVLSIENKGAQPLEAVIVRSLDGDLIFAKIDGWERERLAQDTVLLWTANPLPQGSFSSMVVMTEGNRDLLFRFGGAGGLNSDPIALGYKADQLSAMIQEVLDKVPVVPSGALKIIIRDFNLAQPIANASILISRSSDIVAESMTNANGTTSVELDEGTYSIAIGAESYLAIADILSVTLDSQDAAFRLEPLMKNGSMQAIVFSDHHVTFDQLVLTKDSDCKVGDEAVPHWHTIESMVTATDGTILEDPDPNGCGFGKKSDVEVIQVESEGEVMISANVTTTAFDHVIDVSPCPQAFATINLTASQQGTWVVANAPTWITVTLDKNIVHVEFNCNVDEFVPQSLDGTIELSFKTTQGSSAGTIPISVAGRLVNQ